MRCFKWFCIWRRCNVQTIGSRFCSVNHFILLVDSVLHGIKPPSLNISTLPPFKAPPHPPDKKRIPRSGGRTPCGFFLYLWKHWKISDFWCFQSVKKEKWYKSDLFHYLQFKFSEKTLSTKNNWRQAQEFLRSFSYVLLLNSRLLVQKLLTKHVCIDTCNDSQCCSNHIVTNEEQLVGYFPQNEFLLWKSMRDSLFFENHTSNF